MTALQGVVLVALLFGREGFHTSGGVLSILVFAGLFPLFSVFEAWHLSQRLHQSLQSIHAGFQALGEGRLGYEISLHQHTLCRETVQAFNRMSRQLQENIAKRDVAEGDALAGETSVAVTTVDQATPKGSSLPASLELAPDLSSDMRILLVEDSPEMQIFTREILTSAGFVVGVANNGREALEALACAPFDLVLMDLGMPEMDGWTAVRQIRQLTSRMRDVPIIILTGNTFPGVREACMAIGAQGYLTKPVQHDLLLGSIRALLANPGRVVGSYGPVALPEADSVITALPLLDAAVLQQMARDTAPELVPRMVRIFIQEAEKRRERILLDATGGDVQAMRLEIHALKSSAGTFGAKALYHASTEADLAGKSGDMPTLLRWGQALPNLIQRTIRAYQIHFSES
ncbi:MAG: response regulator [Magnetococcales bacterium]|nr:response regulator [Magnetococcales bacterium]